MTKKKYTDGRRNNRPPKHTQFKPGQSGNPNGAPKKGSPTLLEDINDVFGRKRKITIDGETQDTTTRKIILEQIAREAAKGDIKMIKVALPFLKIMDDTPQFELLPEDREALKYFEEKFKANQGDNDDNGK